MIFKKPIMRFSMSRNMQIMKKFGLVTEVLYSAYILISYWRLPRHPAVIKQPERFLKVQKAWEILCNSSSRSFYDNELRSSRKDVLAADIAEDLSLRKDVLAADVAEDLSLQDMMIEDDGEALELFYQCRCGDYFSVDSWNWRKWDIPYWGWEVGYLYSMLIPYLDQWFFHVDLVR